MAASLSLGEYIRRLRKGKRLQLTEVAEQTGLSLSHLSRIENDIAIPNADTVVRIHRALEGDLEQLLSLADCLPQEILDRLLQRVSENATTLYRAAGDAPDPGYAEAMIADLDPVIRSGLALLFHLSAQDVEGLFTALGRLSLLPPAERDTIIRSFGLTAKG